MINEPKVILDVRGLMIHAAHRGTDKEGFKNPDTGKIEPRAQYAVDSFLESYLIPILKDFAPRNVIAVWDGGSEFRTNLFPSYKAKRRAREKSEFMAEQYELMTKNTKLLLASLGCLQMFVGGVEADDAIALLVQKLPGYKMVYTVDADLGVLASDSCAVLLKGDPMVDEYQGVPLRFISLYKSMVGDTSDEYPGIQGFGPAKWNELVEEFDYDGMEELERCVDSLDFAAIDEALQDSDSKALKMVGEQRYDWVVQYALAKLHPELCEGRRDGKFAKVQWYKRLPDADKFHTVLNWAGCQDLAPKLNHYLPRTILVTNDNLEDTVAHFIDNVAKAPVYAYDYESKDVLKHPTFKEVNQDFVDVLSQSITGMSICYGDNLQHNIYLSCDHRDTNNVEDTILWDFLDEAQQQGVLGIAHNAPFEIALTDTNFEKRLPITLDTRIMGAYVDEEGSHRLKDMSKEYLGYRQATYKETLAAAGVTDLDAGMGDLTGEQVLSYGCDDSFCTGALFDLLHTIMCIEGTWDFCAKNEFKAAHTLYNGFESGLRIDFAKLKQLEDQDAKTMTETMATIRSLLDQHCTQENKEGAQRLYDDLAAFERAKLEADGKDEAEIGKRLTNLWEKLLDGSRYRPLTAVKKSVEFKPTPKQVDAVITKLGFDFVPGGVSKSKINEWAAVAEQQVEPGSEAHDFVLALIDATPEIKNREGEHYDKFHALCTRVMERDADILTTGDELNLDSPNQMQMLLYGKLGLPIRLRSKVQFNSRRDQLGFPGSPSTNDKAIMAALADDVDQEDWRRPLLEAMVEHKSALTRFKMYYRPYPKWRHPRDGLVHVNITNCGTVTHRLTSSNPNGLGISKKGAIRTVVLGREDDHVILSPDFNGEELRITASMSGDETMIDAYIGEERKDIHSLTASAIAHIMLPRYNYERFHDVTQMAYSIFVDALKGGDEELAKYCKNIRGLAKGVNFLILYVGGAPTLAMNLGVPTDVAQAFIDATVARYPGLVAWQDASIEFAREHGYVLTAYGNRRHLSKGIFSDNDYIRHKHERMAVNSQVQGTGSDLLKIVLRRMDEMNLLQQLNGSLIVPPHDEVAISVPRAAAWEAWQAMKEIMSITPPGHAVPQLPELKCSALNWGTCVELGADPTREEMEEVFDKQLAERAAA